MGLTEPGKQFSSRSKDASASGSRCWNFIPNGAILLLFYLLFAGLLVARRPDCIRNPQFWAEEGARFFVDAHERSVWINLATHSLGYFYLSIRLVSQAAAHVPLQHAPLVLVLSALGIQAAVPLFILSSRCANWMGPFPFRFASALLYCGMPNSFEVHCIALNARVHLVILAALIIVSPPPLTSRGKVFDATVLILTGLSGPYALLLAPMALWRHWQAPTSTNWRNCLILFVTFGFAIFAAVMSGGQRAGNIQLGASFWEGVRVIGGQLVIGFLLGEKTYAAILHQSWFDAAAAMSLLFLVLLLIVIIKWGRTELRYLLLIGFGSLAMALAAPVGSQDIPHWRALWSVPGCGQRYYFLPMATLLFALATLAGRAKQWWWRVLAAGLLVLIGAMGARVDWVLPPFTDFHFRTYVALYRSLPPGSYMTVPINPPGWQMKVRKPAQERVSGKNPPITSL
jgi:hypothetical protein